RRRRTYRSSAGKPACGADFRYAPILRSRSRTGSDAISMRRLQRDPVGIPIRIPSAEGILTRRQLVDPADELHQVEIAASIRFCQGRYEPFEIRLAQRQCVLRQRRLETFAVRDES